MKKILLALALSSLAFSAQAQQVNGRATTAAPTYSNATSAPLSLDLSGNLRTTLGASSTIIGNVRIDQTTPGTTNGVQLNAGSAIVGNVRIDQTTPGTTNGVVINSGTLTANQSVNVSQINGVTPLMGAGNTGTGSHRVTISTDQAAMAAAGQGATAAAVPAGATQFGMRSGANMVGAIQADTSAAIAMSTATTTQFVALSGGAKIYITSFDFLAAGTTNVTLVYGTGANCGTGTTSLTGIYTLTAQAGVAKGSGHGPVLVVPAGNAFCVTNSQAIVIGGSISYTQF